jgi:hypothetical protein
MDECTLCNGSGNVVVPCGTKHGVASTIVKVCPSCRGVVYTETPVPMERICEDFAAIAKGLKEIEAGKKTGIITCSMCKDTGWLDAMGVALVCPTCGNPNDKILGGCN